MADDDVQRAIDAVRSGQAILLPTDTVYGLAALARDEEAAYALYRLKGRRPSQPTALLAPDVDALLEAMPELPGEAVAAVRALLPGPFTLVLPNPARRYRWLSGIRPDSIGVRVPELPEPSRRVLDEVGWLVATSANDPGGPNPATLDDVPERIRAACGAELDIGRLPGTPSTVLDLTGPEPYVIREGAVPAAEALTKISSWQSDTRPSSS